MNKTTLNKYEEIRETLENGNFKKASELCVTYGFYAEDLLDFETVGDIPTRTLCLLIEEMTEIRTEEEVSQLAIESFKNYTLGDYQFFYDKGTDNPRVLEKRIENNWNGKDSEKLYKVVDAFTTLQEMLNAIKID